MRGALTNLGRSLSSARRASGCAATACAIAKQSGRAAPASPSTWSRMYSATDTPSGVRAACRLVHGRAASVTGLSGGADMPVLPTHGRQRCGRSHSTPYGRTTSPSKLWPQRASREHLGSGCHRASCTTQLPQEMENAEVGSFLELLLRSDYRAPCWHPLSVPRPDWSILRRTASALPLPEQPKATPVPVDEGLGFHDVQGRTPAVPHVGEPRPQHSVRRRQTHALPGPTDDGQRVTQGDDFHVPGRP